MLELPKTEKSFEPIKPYQVIQRKERKQMHQPISSKAFPSDHKHIASRNVPKKRKAEEKKEGRASVGIKSSDFLARRG